MKGNAAKMIAVALIGMPVLALAVIIFLSLKGALSMGNNFLGEAILSVGAIVLAFLVLSVSVFALFGSIAKLKPKLGFPVEEVPVALPTPQSELKRYASAPPEVKKHVAEQIQKMRKTARSLGQENAGQWDKAEAETRDADSEKDGGGI